MFDGFREWDVHVGADVVLHGRSAGLDDLNKPVVVLLHGHPRTHATWHRVAPRLVAAGYAVVCPDLRGYGRSRAPSTGDPLLTYCDRAMAGDVAGLMRRLGRDRWAVVGHDRGSYVAHRCAVDHPDHVTALAVLDSVPILEALERADARFARSWWHWFFFATPHAERVVNADPLAWYQPDPVLMGQENHDDLLAAITDPATVRAMIADYAASLDVDREHQEADRAAGRRVVAPLLVAWSIHDDMETLYGDPAAIWRDWSAGPLTQARVDSGHHMAEERPAEVAALLDQFLASHLDQEG